VTTGFRLFGLAHLLILGAIPAAAYAVSRVLRRHPLAVRLSLGLLLAANEVVWYGYRLKHEGWRFPEGLPLQMCDLSVWLAVSAALTLSRRVYEPAYFAGVGGAGMAVLTPDLWSPLASYPSIYFFAAHGGVIVIVLPLLWSGLVRPLPGAVWRAFGVLAVFAAAVAVFNAVFGTNYMYLCRKPASASLMDFLGPWPVYVVLSFGIALAVFWLLWLPLRRDSSRLS
jgi:hypothetical integral membrane protein (TIGR02206 family)